jgi:hypothetical protein
LPNDKKGWWSSSGARMLPPRNVPTAPVHLLTTPNPGAGARAAAPVARPQLAWSRCQLADALRSRHASCSLAPRVSADAPT